MVAGRGLRTAAAAERLPIAPPPRDYVDTDYAAHGSTASTGAINITAPPSGVMAVGGYRFLGAGPAGMGAGGSDRARC